MKIEDNDGEHEIKQCSGAENDQHCLACNDPQDLLCGAEGEDLCAICYTSELREEPCVRLGCGHIFHSNCVL